MSVGYIAHGPFGEGPDVEPAAGGEAVGQQQGAMAGRAVGLGAETLSQRLAVDEKVHAVADLASEALPFDFERTALVHSRFRQPHPREAATRKAQPRKINAGITGMTSGTGKTRRTGKASMVRSQKHIPFGEARGAGLTPQPCPKRNCRLRRKLDHRLETAPLLQLSR